MATVPTNRTWAVGEIVTAARLNALRDSLDWSQGDFPRCHVYDGTGITMTNATATLVTWNSEVYDNDTMHSTSSNTSRVTFTTAGLYEVHFRITLGGGSTITTLDMMCRLNANGASGGGTLIRTQPWESGAGLRTAELQFRRAFSAGDYVELFVTQASGANRSLSSTSFGSMCQAHWMAAS